MTRKLTKILLLIIFQFKLLAQFNFHFSIDTISITQDARLHSFSYAKIGDQILFFGGRTDGIHSKISGFEANGANKDLILYDLKKNTSRKVELKLLDTSIYEALGSSAASFFQVKNKLYIIGGYGQNSKGAYSTYPSLIQIDLDTLLKAVDLNTNIIPAFTQLLNDTFAVAGGQLTYLNEKFYLVGGHKFTGKYSNQENQYKQIYTEAVYVFTIDDSRSSLSVKFEHQIKDELNFHRRDFNLSPFYTSSSKIEPMVFAGVFLVNESRPFLNIASIQENFYTDISNFNQQLADYQCAHIGLYSTKDDAMNEVFFGGMAEYYFDASDSLTRDPAVPFVKTISRVERNKNNEYKEYRLSSKMPGFIGTNSEFILDSNVPIINNNIIDLDQINSDSTFLGYILGGIINNSSRINPWQDSMIHLTSVNPKLLKVSLIKNTISSSVDKEINLNKIELHILPNPVADFLKIHADVEVQNLSIWIVSTEGKIKQYNKFKLGSNFELDLTNLPSGNYICYYLINNNYFESKRFFKINRSK